VASRITKDRVDKTRLASGDFTGSDITDYLILTSISLIFQNIFAKLRAHKEGETMKHFSLLLFIVVFFTVAGC
jgi:Na+/melibiose symporter-like transporter